MHTILVCDDDSDIRGAIRIYCIAAGYRVLEAENGEEALEILSREEVSLVLMDVMMPRLDGVEATMRLRGQSNVPVIFLTARDTPEDELLAFGVGGDDFIRKPYNSAVLLARIARILKTTSNETWTVRGLTLDLPGMKAMFGGAAV